MQVTPLFSFPPTQSQFVYFLLGMILYAIASNVAFNEKTFKTRGVWAVIILIIALAVLPNLIFAR